ncbi:hypothetical protein PsorP6_007510 [Peronosclerospora sorghi]|uniref:Uncharacterized protein n=1 Tax=Peronosclerospora sorghi TaxID=230839 RepID=A0ACC0WC29_9STRA|nr:hypothetical protein PsorP6_007510 [Peronosclerospora sorghi]
MVRKFPAELRKCLKFFRRSSCDVHEAGINSRQLLPKQPQRYFKQRETNRVKTEASSLRQGAVKSSDETSLPNAQVEYVSAELSQDLHMNRRFERQTPVRQAIPSVPTHVKCGAFHNLDQVST